jgi:hypothetical protein
MPDTILHVSRFRRNLSRSLLTNRGFDIVLVIFDMRSGDLLVFSFCESLDPVSSGPFPPPFTATFLS